MKSRKDLAVLHAMLSHPSGTTARQLADYLGARRVFRIVRGRWTTAGVAMHLRRWEIAGLMERTIESGDIGVWHLKDRVGAHETLLQYNLPSPAGSPIGGRLT